MRARRFASVRITDQKSCPAFPHPGRAVLNQLHRRRNGRRSSAAPSWSPRLRSNLTGSPSRC